MGYQRINPANIPPSVVNAARRDRSYFRENSSPDVRKIYEAMDEVLDPLEYEGSLLFDEYPDGGEISRMTDRVLRGMCMDTGVENPPLTWELARALLCEEMCRRRLRFFLYRAG